MIDPNTPTEHLEAHAAELDAAQRESIKNLLAIGGPFAMALIGLAAVRKQRRAVRAELANRAQPVEASTSEPEWYTDELGAALDAIRTVLPESMFITVDSDGHVRLVRAGGEELFGIADPIGVVNDPQRLQELVEAARRFDGV